jgi:hypothetical protein
MPVRLLNSSVLRWPNRDEVDKVARDWAGTESARHPELCGLAYFGSYARGDWGASVPCFSPQLGSLQHNLCIDGKIG